MDKYIVEIAEDLSFNPKEFPLSHEIKELLIKYSKDNITLANGQKIFLNIPDMEKEKMFDYFQRTLIEFIESEKLLKKCNDIKATYISNINSINNTSSYVKMTFDIIKNMDIVNKYIFSVFKIHVDGINNFKTEYVNWIKRTTKIEDNVIERWILIHNIRCKLEHPESLETTFFSRTQSEVILPKIKYEEEFYDLLQLAEDALSCICLFFKAIIGATLLYSKYLIAFTDESGNALYRN